MKIAIAQLNYHIGNFDANFDKISTSILKAKELGADIVVFGELAVCGYPPRDFLEFKDFITRCIDVIEKIKAMSEGIAVVVGAPSINPDPEGKDLFNSAYFIADGRIIDVIHKTLLPTYDIFDEYRYFEPNRSWRTVNYGGKKIALSVCEDIWNIGNENPLYTTCPMDHLIMENPDLMINISASPFDYDHQKDRIEILKENCNRYNLPIVYVNHVGAQTEIIFDGSSFAMTSFGDVYDQMSSFKEEMKIYDLQDLQQKTAVDNFEDPGKISLIKDALVLGVKDYFGKLGFKKAILGLSGGIDSAVTLCIAAEALGKKNVTSVLMPSPYSSDHSISDSEKLLQNTGSPSHKISINSMYEVFLNELNPYFQDKALGVTEENIQARVRSVILMALSNKFGYILLNTSNKSEAAVGYGTLYGDMSGGLSVIGDVYKTEVFKLARHLNAQSEIIPENIIIKPPSAELKPDQKDTDSLPPYEELDPILFSYIEGRLGPKEIIALGYPEELVSRILKMVNINEYKRHQTAPVLRVSPKAFGMGRRMPIVGKYLS
ncbi:MAG: NAD+ synthase [Chitinophagales bacterium]|nr:NAD+ synthase [Chitinophagales bacterium]